MDELISRLSEAQTDNKITGDTLNNAKAWLANSQVETYHNQIQKLIDDQNWQAINDAFFKQIEFGTAGIRGKTGLGSARINEWTVGTATQGFADYLTSLGESAKQQGVVIGSDTRLTSPEYVQLVADILTSNGIKIYKFDRPPQVGMFSFAVRLYKAQAGIYISASHNPPTDNGLKIYWEDGAQVLPPHDKAITEAVKKVEKVEKSNKDSGLVEIIGEDFDTTYRTRVLHESVYSGRSAKVVYSPFHGTGQYGVLPILQEAGFNVITVDEQMKPDGNFPNVPGGVPNPQNKESNGLTAKKVLETGADVGLSTDPDADRIGVVIPKNGETVILDGNQTAAITAYFVCRQLKEAGQLPSNGFLARTIVTTPLIDAIAEDFEQKCYNTLPVGFKFIGEAIRQYEDMGNELFIFGGEESFGSLKGSYARDKDASVAALLAAELVSWAKEQGKTVWDIFDEIYAKYGYFHNEAADIYYEGAEGFTKMANLMASLRQNPPQQVGEWKVKSIIDKKTNEIKDTNGKVTGTAEGATANMVVLQLSDDGRSSIIVRPSGTEPKVKLYISLYDEAAKGGNVDKVQQDTTATSAALIAALKTLATELAG